MPTLLQMEGANNLTDSRENGVMAGLEATGTSLWEAAVEIGGPVADQVVRQALMPIHTRRMSTLRVREAVDAQRAALGPPLSNCEA